MLKNFTPQTFGMIRLLFPSLLKNVVHIQCYPLQKDTA